MNIKGPLNRRESIAMAAGLLAASALPTAAYAQSNGYPNKAVRLAVGFAAGTGPDVLARTVGHKLGELLKQPVVVENRTGAGGQIAAQFVAKSNADGYTTLIADVGSISIAPAAFSRLPYDPMKELVPVSELVRTDFVLVVPTTSKAQSAADLFKAAVASKEKVNFATFGAGTPGHFGAEGLARDIGFQVEAVHYRNTGDVVTAIIAGDVQAALVSTALAMAQVKGGRMKALAITSAERSALLPDVPTFAEQGYPKADYSAWFCLFVPAGTPAHVMNTLHQQAVQALQAPDLRRSMEEQGFRIIGSTQEEAMRMMAAETARWKVIVDATGFKGD